MILAALLLNLQGCLWFLSIFQSMQSGFHISAPIALVMHNMEWMKPYKINPNETLDLYQSLNLIPLHHEIGYLEFLIPEWYYEFEKYSGTKCSLVPHFRTNLYTRIRLVYQTGDTIQTLVWTILMLGEYFLWLVRSSQH
jgi:hypothetical protein